MIADDGPGDNLLPSAFLSIFAGRSRVSLFRVMVFNKANHTLYREMALWMPVSASYPLLSVWSSSP